MQPDETDELAGFTQLNPPDAPSALCYQIPAAGRHFIALLAGQHGWEKFHHLWICIHCSKGGEIIVLPLPEDQSCRLDIECRGSDRNGKCIHQCLLYRAIFQTDKYSF